MSGTTQPKNQRLKVTVFKDNEGATEVANYPTSRSKHILFDTTSFGMRTGRKYLGRAN